MMVQVVTLIVNQATLIRLMTVQTRPAEDVKPVKRPECLPVQSRAVRKPSSGIQLWSATVSLRTHEIPREDNPSRSSQD